MELGISWALPPISFAAFETGVFPLNLHQECGKSWSSTEVIPTMVFQHLKIRHLAIARGKKVLNTRGCPWQSRGDLGLFENYPGNLCGRYREPPRVNP